MPREKILRTTNVLSSSLGIDTASGAGAYAGCANKDTGEIAPQALGYIDRGRTSQIIQKP